jgi:hypothetical protein
MKLLLSTALSLVIGISAANAATATQTLPSTGTAFTSIDDDFLENLGFDLENSIVVDFDTDADGNPIPGGTLLSDQYGSQGISISGGAIAASFIFGGPVSEPNGSYTPGGQQVFSFDRAVRRVGIVNTSSDGDTYTVFGQTGNALGSTTDRPTGEDIFVMFTANANEDIFSFVITSVGGEGIGVELDNLVVEFAADPVPLPGAMALFATGAFVLRKRRQN